MFDEKGLLSYKRLSKEKRKEIENRKRGEFLRDLSNDIDQKVNRIFSADERKTIKVRDQLGMKQVVT